MGLRSLSLCVWMWMCASPGEKKISWVRCILFRDFGLWTHLSRVSTFSFLPFPFSFPSSEAILLPRWMACVPSNEVNCVRSRVDSNTLWMLEKEKGREDVLKSWLESTLEKRDLLHTGTWLRRDDKTQVFHGVWLSSTPIIGVGEETKPTREMKWQATQGKRRGGMRQKLSSSIHLLLFYLFYSTSLPRVSLRVASTFPLVDRHLKL